MWWLFLIVGMEPSDHPGVLLGVYVCVYWLQEEAHVNKIQ